MAQSLKKQSDKSASLVSKQKQLWPLLFILFLLKKKTSKKVWNGHLQLLFVRGLATASRARWSPNFRSAPTTRSSRRLTPRGRRFQIVGRSSGRPRNSSPKIQGDEILGTLTFWWSLQSKKKISLSKWKTV